MQNNYANFKTAAKKLRGINHPFRQQIYEFLTVPTTVTEIYVHFKAEQSIVSQQLGIMRKTGWVKTTRQGKYIYYEQNKQHFEAAQKSIITFLNS